VVWAPRVPPGYPDPGPRMKAYLDRVRFARPRPRFERRPNPLGPSVEVDAVIRLL